ncbi:MAG: IS66 family insertion sequence element accessory protein TnpA [Planctomyces sp.]
MGRRADDRKRDEWIQRFRRRKTSGLTVATFCEWLGVSVAAFYRWRKKLVPGIRRSVNGRHRSSREVRSFADKSLIPASSYRSARRGKIGFALHRVSSAEWCPHLRSVLLCEHNTANAGNNTCPATNSSSEVTSSD